jgi:rhodanese-related sulfurtransferase
MSMATTLARELTPSEVAPLLQNGAGPTVLDVRTPAEFESAHIPDSFNVPLDLLPKHREELSRRLGGPAVLVCRTGARARQAETLLREVDLLDLQVLDGGLAAWEKAGLPLKRGKHRWDMFRQVRGIAGSLVLIGALGSLLWPPLIWLSIFVGGGLLFSAITDFCGMVKVLELLPYNRSAATDVRATLERMATKT